MKDKRKFKRFPVELDAKYSLEINQKEWKTCKVVNVGREGMGIEVHLQEKFRTGSILKIEVLVPPRDEPVKAVGILRWIKDSGVTVHYTKKCKHRGIICFICLQIACAVW